MTNKLDSLGIENSLNLFSEQIKRTYQESLNSNIEKLDFDSIVISGMGGSSNAGKLIQSWQEKINSKELITYNGYGLPSFCNEKTLIILNSYSGNTEETLSGYESAKQSKSQIIGITTGGKLASLINSGEIKGSIFSTGETNPSDYPKSGLGLSLGALIGALEMVGYLDKPEVEINSSLQKLEDIRASWNVADVATWLNGYTPVYLGNRDLIGGLNAGRNATCEIGRTYTQFYDFPEVNHVLIEALMEPHVVKNNKYLFFESKFDNERIKLRYKVTKELFNQMELDYKSYLLRSDSLIGQLLEIAHFGAWLGFELSILRNDDPGPEPWIIKLKESLSQPVH